MTKDTPLVLVSILSDRFLTEGRIRSELLADARYKRPRDVFLINSRKRFPSASNRGAHMICSLVDCRIK